MTEIRIPWNGDPLHLDGRSWGDRDAPFLKTRTVDRHVDALVTVGLEPAGVPILVPGASSRRD